MLSKSLGQQFPFFREKTKLSKEVRFARAIIVL